MQLVALLLAVLELKQGQDHVVSDVMIKQKIKHVIAVRYGPIGVRSRVWALVALERKLEQGLVVVHVRTK